MGPFVRAVMRAEDAIFGCWEYEYARARGWDAAGTAVYLASRAVANGPEWGEAVEAGRRAEVKEMFGRSVVEQIREVW
jgi:hypothetical protein